MATTVHPVTHIRRAIRSMYQLTPVKETYHYRGPELQYTDLQFADSIRTTLSSPQADPLEFLLQVVYRLGQEDGRWQEVIRNARRGAEQLETLKAQNPELARQLTVHNQTQYVPAA
ncbi:hypothetical protein CLV58_109213 [Spirosoma oryzae]|uniref:Uncharacterized protein n=1 Tax=Spirosoma oryzae TaxID=1469603 RepID=A0A2T0SYJ8_9BACT|nr:hypothetical protein [Spirosoma oryzae]PRY38486.1 hypothetical protein CLV58_109213 [Spirosoma oryzae]